jgi:hypothetical protein
MRANHSATHAHALSDDTHDPPESAPASQRQTFDVGAIASIAGLHDTGGHVPLAHCVAMRTGLPLPDVVSRDEMRVLLRVDGATSLGEIADETEIALAEVVAIFLNLLAQGIVEVPWQEPPTSQVVAKNE